MSYKKWIIADFDKAFAKKIAEECDIDPIAALILSSRGYDDPFEIEQFLSDDPIISSHRELLDIDKAVECIKNSMQNDELIAIYGDYDCDGICATAILYKYFSSKNVRCIYYIPDRFTEGYGINSNAIDALYSKGVGTIITVDNGISAIQEIEYAKTLGIKVVVTDHHLPKETLPDACAVVNPHRDNSQFTFKDVCGTVVAYKLICALEDKDPEELLDYYSDFLAIATIGDIMPLIDENRDIVKCGINKIKYKPSTGIEAIISVAGITRNDINSTKIAFGVVPRINASGRMGDASRAVELLLCDNILSALEIANRIDEDNIERHRVEETIFKEACEIVEKNNYQYNRIIVVAGEDWHSGVLGIVASKLSNKYGKPTIVLTIDGENAYGSGRSAGEFSLFDAIDSCSDILTKYGGHDAAAGLTLAYKDIEHFRLKINDYLLKNTVFSPPCVRLDCKLNPIALSTDICYSFASLEPFGQKNPTPVFGLFECTIDRITPIGSGKHLRIFLKRENVTFQAVLFGCNEENFAFQIGDTVDLAVGLEINSYNGNQNLSIKIKEMRLSDCDEEKLFSDISKCDCLFSETDVEYSPISLSREEIGEVYRSITAPKSKEFIINRFLKTLGYAKVYIAIEILCELSLIKFDNGLLYPIKNSVKTNLNNSVLYRKLLEKGAQNDVN